MKEVLGDQIDANIREVAAEFLRFAKKRVTLRKCLVAVFTYALRAALDELSPDEQATWKQLAVEEIQR